MPDFYSQHGEDFLLNEFFRGKAQGFFVEVGCIDGRRFSNSLAFEEMGWKGICVEAHAGYIELLKRNRPNSIICHCAVGEKDEEDVVFYANARGSLSTLDKSLEDRWKRDFSRYFSGFEEQRVNKMRLDSIFSRHGVKEIDFLSIDIEGYEVQALKGMEFRDFRPRVIIVESDGPAHREAIDDILLPNGYHEACPLSGNLFYSLDPDFNSRLMDKVFKGIRLIHTMHPLDSDGDKVVTVDIDTRGDRKPQGSSLRSLLTKRISRPKG
jgi:FkbM family methyltransferase